MLTIDVISYSQARISSAQKLVNDEDDEADVKKLEDANELRSASKFTPSISQLGLKWFVVFFFATQQRSISPLTCGNFSSPRVSQPSIKKTSNKHHQYRRGFSHMLALKREYLRFWLILIPPCGLKAIPAWLRRVVVRFSTAVVDV